MAQLVLHNKLKIKTKGGSMANGIRTNDSRGFSLIELLVSLVILSVSLLALASLLITSVHTNQQNEYRNAAVRLTTETAENLLAQPIDSLPDGASSSNVSVKIRGKDLTYTVSTNVNTLSNELKQVNITVQLQYALNGNYYTNKSVIYKHRSI
jgi:type IV pilus modification protein PilV